jgi:transcriptional regulator with XRE-family HTH domain
MLRKLRERRDMSMADLAAKAKVTDAYIAMLETGTRKNPSLTILKRLAKALGVPVTELLE